MTREELVLKVQDACLENNLSYESVFAVNAVRIIVKMPSGDTEFQVSGRGVQVTHRKNFKITDPNFAEVFNIIKEAGKQ